MRTILIIGTQSSFITEAIEICESAGFKRIVLVDNLNSQDKKDIDGYKIWHLNKLKLADPNKNFIICLHTPIFKEKVLESIKNYHLKPFSVSHLSAIISPRAEISSKAVLIGAKAVIGSHTQISDFVLINRGALIGHDIQIGKFTTIESGVSIGGFCQIGEKSYIGMNASILPKVKIGRNSVVAAGAVVRENVPNNTMVAGIPAIVKKTNIPGYIPKEND